MHNAFFSFGETIGQPHCAIPDDGLPWQPTRQPIVLDAWPSREVPRDACFTTVMQWDSYDSQTHEGQRYGMKSASFDPFMSLPRRIDAKVELAIGGRAERRGGG